MANGGLRAFPGLLLALGVAACERPDWTNPETSKGPREPPPQAAPVKPPVPTSPDPAPPPPAWVVDMLGKDLRTAFPKSGPCVGNTDVVAVRHLGPPAGTKLLGWGWDPVRKQPLPRVVLVDSDRRIVGGGNGGEDRIDIPPVMPQVTSTKTGWSAAIPLTAGRVETFGVLDDGAICPLGGADL